MDRKPTQYEQENDLGRGGGEVDDETLDKAWKDAATRRGTANADDESEQEGPGPWAKTSSGDADEV
jgi:hypothetical protein